MIDSVQGHCSERRHVGAAGGPVARVSTYGLVAAAIAVGAAATAGEVRAQSPASQTTSLQIGIEDTDGNPRPDAEMRELPAVVESALAPDQIPSTVKWTAGLTVLSLAPSLLIMTTCFVRFVIVFGLLKQALGTQTIPPNQVVVALALFLTFLVMTPVWEQSYDAGIRPYAATDSNRGRIDFSTAVRRTVQPVRRFMSRQIKEVENEDVVWMLLDYRNQSSRSSRYSAPKTYDDLPLSVLLPSYLVSELKTAFAIGFQLYLPFLVIDMVVSAILVSMGMMMMPPTLVSLPFKLLLFVLVDGWFLTVGMLLESVGSV